MLEINTTTMQIALTRGDSASITFGAVDENGNVWNPQYTTDKMKFAVSKKWGGTVLMECVNTYDGNPYTEVEIDQATFNADKTKYYDQAGMLTGTHVIDGVSYTFDENGVLVQD